MENKIYANPKYKCAICGNVHDKVEDRMQCEMTCLRKQAEEAKRVAEEKKKAEHDARKAELDMAIEKAIKLKDAYIKDYGFASIVTKSDDWASSFAHDFHWCF